MNRMLSLPVALLLLACGCRMCACPYDYCGPVVDGDCGGCSSCGSSYGGPGYGPSYSDSGRSVPHSGNQYAAQNYSGENYQYASQNYRGAPGANYSDQPSPGYRRGGNQYAAQNYRSNEQIEYSESPPPGWRGNRNQYAAQNYRSGEQMEYSDSPPPGSRGYRSGYASQNYRNTSGQYADAPSYASRPSRNQYSQDYRRSEPQWNDDRRSSPGSNYDRAPAYAARPVSRSSIDRQSRMAPTPAHQEREWPFDGNAEESTALRLPSPDISPVR